jgi:hypothetical protein
MYLGVAWQAEAPAEPKPKPNPPDDYGIDDDESEDWKLA